ncbi:unnamed protein product [Adineta ricciae]|uniref:Uncharacterized protein n=1 Tax=Adineta ricciae TaxID=249248 RepID=A0A815FBM8_ADIRI|nr:unnamed protein product [Adineta ricciae]CAF1393862.1 unnamed protein product [Adineta ricciae]
MSGVIHRQQKLCSSTIQPLDRHLSEIDEKDGTIYINAGIDSTCCKKRSRMIHTLTNGIVISTNGQNFNDDLLNRNSRQNECHSRSNGCCSHCGK